MSTKKNNAAVLNFANINTEALQAINTAILATGTYSQKFNEAKKLRSELSATLTGTELKENAALKQANKAASEAKKRAESLSLSVLIKYQPMTAIMGDIYTDFDVEYFLQGIGALSEGEMSAKTTEKVRKWTSLVINRTTCKYNPKQDKLVLKEVKNTSYEVIYAVAVAMIESGAIVRGTKGLEVKTF